MGLYLCLASFALSLILGMRARVLGIGAVLLVGYLYGILRGNFLDGFTHFIFDATVAGLYVSLFFLRVTTAGRSGAWALEGWVKVLVRWRVLISLWPIQHPLIHLGGRRANAFLLPFL